MEVNSRDWSPPRHLAEGLSQVTTRWESALDGMKLSEADIDAQARSSDDLAASLTRLDQLLEDPSLLPSLWLDMSTDAPAIFVDEESAPDQASKVTPENMLAGRQSQILRLLKRANKNAKDDLLSRKKNEESLGIEEMQQIDGELKRLDDDAERLEKDRNEANALSDQRRLNRELEIQRLQAEIEENKSRFDLEREETRAELKLVAEKTRAQIKNRRWQTLLGRDSIAAIVGGLILIGFATAAIVAMFTDTEMTDVVQNSFLLILGYFFGAAVARRPGGASDQDAPRAPTP
ncbi:MAG: hypothetical protein IIC72_12270 [Acidobacteria bacterium]|nr:hypothetical protein [Acidobacteriota bacterium]